MGVFLLPKHGQKEDIKVQYHFNGTMTNLLGDNAIIETYDQKYRTRIYLQVKCDEKKRR